MYTEKNVRQIAEIIGADKVRQIKRVFGLPASFLPQVVDFPRLIRVAKSAEELLDISQEATDSDVRLKAFNKAFEIMKARKELLDEIARANTVAECNVIYCSLDENSLEAGACIVKMLQILKKQK